MSLNIANCRYIKVWEVKEGKFGKEFNLGSSRKLKDDGGFKNSNWWNCRLVLGAKELGDTLVKGDLIKIISGSLENVYDKEKKVAYFNLTVFEAELENNENVKPKAKKKVESTEESEDDTFPFR